MTTFPLNSPAEPRAFNPEYAANTVSDLQFDLIVETVDLAASYARSASEAAWRGDRLTVGVHLRQLRLCVITAIQTFGVETCGKGRV